MKNISNEEKKLWMSSSQPKDLKITLTPPSGEDIVLTNTDIVSESLEITQILESGNTLSFGDCNASSLKIKCRDFETDVRGWKLEAKLTFKNYPQYSQILFVGIVDSQANQNHEDVTTTITAYDLIKTINELDMTKWWDGLTISKNKPFSYYVDLIVNRFVSLVGCTGLNNTDKGKMANLTQVIADKPDLIADYQNISGEMLLKWIAQACNVYLTMDGAKLKAVKLGVMSKALLPHIGLYPRVGLHPSKSTHDISIPTGEYISATYEPYSTELIDQVIITDKGEIGEGQYPVQAEQGNNVLFLDGNPFLWEMNMAQCAQAIYERVRNVWFTPNKVNCVGTVFMELGDIARVHTVKNAIYTYILKRTIKGINSIRDTFTDSSEQYQTAHKPSYADVTDLQSQSILRINADIVKLNKLVAADISADRITSGTLDANKVTVKNLVVTNSMVSGRISADHLDSKTITTDNLSANVATLGYATVTSLNATNARVGTLEGDHVKVSDLNATNARVGSLEADHVSTSTITTMNATIKGKASITDLNAVSARVGTLEADHVSTSTITTMNATINGKASVTDLNAVSARVTTIESNYISASTVKADYMEVANWTSSGYIKASKISASSITSIIENADSITTKNLTVANGGSIYMYYNGTSTTYRPRTITVGSKTGKILADSTWS